VIRACHSSNENFEPYYSVPKEVKWNTTYNAKAHGYYYAPQVIFNFNVTNDHPGSRGVITQAYCLTLSFKFQCALAYTQSDLDQLNFNNRPNRLTQCCTQFKPFGNKTFCFI